MAAPDGVDPAAWAALLKWSIAQTGEGDGTSSTGYGDHPTDMPMLQACDRGVLVHSYDFDELPKGIELELPTPYPPTMLPEPPPPDEKS